MTQKYKIILHNVRVDGYKKMFLHTQKENSNGNLQVEDKKMADISAIYCGHSIDATLFKLLLFIIIIDIKSNKS